MGLQKRGCHEKWAVKRGRVMQIYVRVHEEVHPKKEKEVLYFVKKSLGEIGELSDQRQNQSRTFNAVI